MYMAILLNMLIQMNFRHPGIAEQLSARYLRLLSALRRGFASVLLQGLILPEV